MSCLVVSWDSDVDEFQGCICVAESDDGNVDVRCLTNGLVVHTRVSDDDETGFFERSGNVVGERTGGESSSNGLSTSVGCVFEHGTVTVRTGRDDTNIIRVFNGSNDTSSENEFFPGLSNVENMNTWIMKA